MKYNSVFKNGKISMCLFLLLLVIGCSILAVVFPHGTMIVEGLVSGTGSVTSGNSNSQGVDLSKISNMNNVACSQMWQNLVADGAGYTMVNALQSPDGSCVVDYMDTDGLFYTETWSSQNNGVVPTNSPSNSTTISPSNSTTISPSNSTTISPSNSTTISPSNSRVGGVVRTGQRTMVHEI